MLRRLLLAAAIALAPSIASAQFATIGATPATSDSSDKLANTQWVNNLVNAGLPLASGKIWIGSAGNIATAQTPSGDCTLSLSGVITCTQAAGNFQVIGSLTVNGLLVDGNGELMTNIVAPATPAAGTTRIYVDSTTKVLTFKNDAGTVGNATVPSTCGANLFGTSISAAGVFGCTQPAITNISGLGSGCATWLATPSSANLRGCLNDETGTGLAYFQGGDIGTPSAGVGTNLTALNASNLSSGTVAAARGGAGTITGALRGSGAGVVTQAACADLSNASVYCSATQGQLPGATTNTAASAGNIGEYMETVIASGSAVALVNNVSKDVACKSLTAGNWLVSGQGVFGPAATTSQTYVAFGISIVANTIDFTGTQWTQQQGAAFVSGGVGTAVAVPIARLSLTTTTSVCVVAQAGFTVSTAGAYGAVKAWRTN